MAGTITIIIIIIIITITIIIDEVVSSILCILAFDLKAFWKYLKWGTFGDGLPPFWKIPVIVLSPPIILC